MRANKIFSRQSKDFWAHVRSLSEAQGYTDRKTGGIKRLTLSSMVDSMNRLGLNSNHLVAQGNPTIMGQLLIDYFDYRTDMLDNFVQPRLMDAEQAAAAYEEVKEKYKPTLLPTMNKQKDDKKKVAYLTAIVSAIVEHVAGPKGFDPDPRQLTTFTKNSIPLRTLSRRVDGALPGVVNPVAIWEIKEYYYTTTFGSRVADGVYETLLDGMELEEMHEHEGLNIEHMLALDARYTWWDCGRSYLCRIVDMLHMGYVDEVLFGYEVVERLPTLAAEWVRAAKEASNKEPQLDEYGQSAKLF